MALDEYDAGREEIFRIPQPRLIDPRRGWRQTAHPHPTQRAQRRRATCSVMSHWGEVIQGPVMFEGRPQVALVTLPDPSNHVSASAVPMRSGSQISCDPPSKAKAFEAARLVIEKWAPGLGVNLTFHSTIPEGVGAGSSTADCTATVYAILGMLGVSPSRAWEQEILAEVFAAEGPCDPLILLDPGTTVLWGSRSGKLIESYDVPLPPFEALGFVSDPDRTVSTVELAKEQARRPATPSETEAFAVVLRDFEQALVARSARGVAEAAMASGSLNQGRCPIEHWDELTKLSEQVGALGVSCAHSGTAAAFLFDPNADDLDARLDRARQKLRTLRAALIHRFRTDSTPPSWAGAHTMTIEPLSEA